MKILKYLFVLSLIAYLFTGCKKDNFSDTSFVKTAVDPAALSVLFEITQDNSGLVTITPNGEGAVSFDVFYGDNTTTSASVQAGKNTTHTYAEGLYDVKIVAHSINGKSTEITKKLTVSFRQPEDLDFTVTVDPNDSYKIKVSATALYETNFKVYFGDVPNEAGFAFLEGVEVSHTYAAIGNYNVKVVALSGGAATTQLIKPITIVDPVLLPLTFESPTVKYDFLDFGGGVITKVANPYATGINTSATVGKMVKNAGEVYGGSTIPLGAPIDFSTNKIFRMKVYSPRADAKVLLKLENLTDGSISAEKEVAVGVANAWQDLAFDFTAIDVSKSYQKITLIFDLGTVGDGTANYTYYFDDIRQTNSLPSSQLSLPITFDDPNVVYNTVDFGGNVTTDALDPLNNGNHIKSTVKTSGAETWAGTTVGSGLSTKVPFTASATKMTIRVYSTVVGQPVRLKLEDHTNNTHTVETEAMTTVANAWETLTFDFANPATGTAALNLSYTYDLPSIFFNFGASGSGQIYKWDDIQFNADVAATLALPLDFQSTTLNYAFTDFEGGVATVINNTQISGINTSTKVGKMVKNAGQTYGGSFITMVAPIDFSTMRTMKMKVYSPRVGAKVLLKVENLTDGNTGFQQEVSSTVANAWEELSFDFSTIDVSKSYQKVVLIFDNGTMGDGSANFTFLFDDIKQTP